MSLKMGSFDVILESENPPQTWVDKFWSGALSLTAVSNDDKWIQIQSNGTLKQKCCLKDVV